MGTGLTTFLGSHYEENCSQDKQQLRRMIKWSCHFCWYNTKKRYGLGSKQDSKLASASCQWCELGQFNLSTDFHLCKIRSTITIIKLSSGVLHYYCTLWTWASLIAQLVKNLPEIPEPLVQFLGWEDLLQKEQAIHSSILGLPLWLSW